MTPSWYSICNKLQQHVLRWFVVFAVCIGVCVSTRTYIIANVNRIIIYRCRITMLVFFSLAISILCIGDATVIDAPYQPLLELAALPEGALGTISNISLNFM